MSKHFGEPPPVQNIDYKNVTVNHGNNKTEGSGWNDPHLLYQQLSKKIEPNGNLGQKDNLLEAIEKYKLKCAESKNKKLGLDIAKRLQILNEELNSDNLDKVTTELLNKLFQAIDKSDFNVCLELIAQLQLLSTKDEHVKWTLGLKRLISVFQESQ